MDQAAGDVEVGEASGEEVHGHATSCGKAVWGKVHVLQEWVRLRLLTSWVAIAR